MMFMLQGYNNLAGSYFITSETYVHFENNVTLG